MQKVRKLQRIENTQALLLCMVYVSKVRLSQFEWKSRTHPLRHGSRTATDSLSFVIPANFPRAVTVRRMANDVTYTMYTALPIHYVYNLCTHTLTLTPTPTPSHTLTHTQYIQGRRSEEIESSCRIISRPPNTCYRHYQRVWNTHTST